MAARNFKKVQTLTPELVMLAGYVVGAGTSAPTNPTGFSKPGPGIASVVRTGSGLYTITLEDRYAQVPVVELSVVDAGTADDWVVNPLVISESAKTITCAVYKSGVAADLTTSQRMQIMVLARNSNNKL